MKNKLISFLLAVLIVALFLFLMLPSAHQKSLDSKEKVYKKSLDSLKIVLEALSRKDSLYRDQLAKARINQNKAEKKAIYWQLQYEDLKNRPVPHLSDADIDSALLRLYAR